MAIHPTRVRPLNAAGLSPDADHVLYWMTANRRPSHNHTLDHAVEHARTLKQPLLVLEALRLDYRWASVRLHQFVLDGMADNHAAFSKLGVTYYPYIEPRQGAGAGLLEALAANASVVVTDDFPCFFLPHMVRAAAAKLERLGVRLEAVDGNGIYPMRDTDRVFTTAASFRRHLQKRLPSFFEDAPAASPFARHLPKGATVKASIQKKWPMVKPQLLATGRVVELGPMDLNKEVTAVAQRGGACAARAKLKRFLEGGLASYAQGRNQPDDDQASGLSPYLHFGFVSAHEIFAEVTSAENWSPLSIAPAPNGSREGWWGMTPDAETFLDQLITWRELGYNRAAHAGDGPAALDTLPEWAKRTIDEHRADARPVCYSLEAFERSQTHDPIWNAAQRELVQKGCMHNYLRMLWGKKIFEWCKRPEDALEIMVHLNNKYALDGRNPNSYSGIFWVLGRYDRAWGPERPIFGKLRYMSSDSTRRKLRLDGYLKRYGNDAATAD